MAQPEILFGGAVQLDIFKLKISINELKANAEFYLGHTSLGLEGENDPLHHFLLYATCGEKSLKIVKGVKIIQVPKIQAQLVK
jgi:hypothetical protein